MDLPPTLDIGSPDIGTAPTGGTIDYRLINDDDAKCITFSPAVEVAIGRDAKTCKLCFPQCAIMSRTHCRVFSLGRDVFVHDHSSNGTFLNGKLVGRDGKRKLRNGDSIAVVNPDLQDAASWTWKFIGPPEEEQAPEDPVSQAYTLGRVLGTGNFATVRLGTSHTTGQKVAIKIVEKKRFAMQADFSFSSLQSEVEILRKMQHQNIISVVDVFDDPKAFTMVLELVSGGDLFDYIVGRGVKPFTEDEARGLFVQLLEAMLYMHSKDVVHRDLKPENILVHVDPSLQLPSNDHQQNAKAIHPSKVTMKITDFGLAKFCSEQEVMTTMCGTPSYLAPEVVTPNADGTKRAAGYGWTVDVWSLGVILYILLSGTPPKSPQQGVAFNKYFEHVSKDGKDLIEFMLQADPSKRADLNDIVHHSWLAGINVKGKELALKHDKLQLQGTIMVQPSKTVQVGLGAGSGLDSPAKLDGAISTSTIPDGGGPGLNNKAGDGNVTEAEDSDSDDEPKKRGREEPNVVWKWKKHLAGKDDDDASWEPYKSDDVEFIEKMQQRGVKTCRLMSTADYRISFEGMFQYCKTDTSKQRPVKRFVCQ